VAISEYVAGLRKHVGHEMLMLPGVSAVVVNEAGEILLGRRSDNGAWSLPAGTVDPGEQPAEAVIREIYEETGVHAAIERLAGVALHPVLYPNGDRCEYLNVFFRCRPTGGEARVNDGEMTEVAWFPVDALPPVNGWARLRIVEALRETDSAWYVEPGSTHEGLTQPRAL
jgi:8-oxo-dGTP diphosphatase